MQKTEKTHFFKPINAVVRQVEFFYSNKFLPKRQFATAILLSLIVLLSETLGFASIYPIVSFLENERNLQDFESSSQINVIFLKIYNFIGLEISLISMICMTIAFILFRQISNYFFAFYSERFKWQLGMRIGRRVLEKMLNSRASFITSISRGNLITSIDYECQAIATIALVYIMVFQLVVSFSAYFILSVVTAPIPALVSITALSVVAFALKFLITRMHSLSTTSVTRRQEFVSLISEIYGAWKVIKINGTKDFELHRFFRSGNALVDLRTMMTKTSSKIELIFVPIISAILLFSVFVMIEVFDYSVAAITIYLATMTRMLPMAQNFQRRLAQIAQYDPSLAKVESLIRQADGSHEITTKGAKFGRLSEGIQLRDVSFKYENSSALIIRNLDASFPSKSLNAIVGRSGSGKTTLTDLISGILLPTGGEIWIDGKPLTSFAQQSYRDKIAIVSQETFLFNASVYDNLIYGNRDVTDTNIWDALRAVKLDEFVQNLPNRLHEKISDGATNISGGQKQRLSIARAFLKKPKILILDEPTSALDSKSEEAVMRALRDLINKKNVTIFIVTHNLRLAKTADYVLRIEGGRKL